MRKRLSPVVFSSLSLLKYDLKMPKPFESPRFILENGQTNKTHTVINIKSVGEDEQVELSYYVKLKDMDESNVFIKNLSSVPGVEYVNLYFDEEQF